LLQWVCAPLLPLAGVWVITTFKRSRILIFRVFNICTTVSADVPKLTIPAFRDLVLLDMPYFLKLRIIYHIYQLGISDIAIAFGHARAVFNITIDIDRNFTIETGVVMLGLGEKRSVSLKISCTNSTTGNRFA